MNSGDYRHALPQRAQVATGIRRLLAPNPSAMTGPGTNTYLVGASAIAVIDPGPAIDSHIDAIVDYADAPIRWVLVTHTHPDHSPAAGRLAARCDAELLGMPAPDGPHQDRSFVPGRVLADGDRLSTDEFELLAVHTPGHASNHLCYRDTASGIVVTGDHIIKGSTVVINPPDGDMAAYLASLRKVRDLQPPALLPGHGDRIDDPAELIDWIIEHRLVREAGVLAAWRENPGSSLDELVAAVYTDVPEHLHSWAARSLLAHLIKLRDDGLVDAGNWQD